MKRKTRTIKRTRDSRTGKFVRDGTEKRRPDTTTRETIKIPPKRKK